MAKNSAVNELTLMEKMLSPGGALAEGSTHTPDNTPKTFSTLPAPPQEPIPTEPEHINEPGRQIIRLVEALKKRQETKNNIDAATLQRETTELNTRLKISLIKLCQHASAAPEEYGLLASILLKPDDILLHQQHVFGRPYFFDNAVAPFNEMTKQSILIKVLSEVRNICIAAKLALKPLQPTQAQSILERWTQQRASTTQTTQQQADFSEHALLVPAFVAENAPATTSSNTATVQTPSSNKVDPIDTVLAELSKGNHGPENENRILSLLISITRHSAAVSAENQAATVFRKVQKKRDAYLINVSENLLVDSIAGAYRGAIANALVVREGFYLFEGSEAESIPDKPHDTTPVFVDPSLQDFFETQGILVLVRDALAEIKSQLNTARQLDDLLTKVNLLLDKATEQYALSSSTVDIQEKTLEDFYQKHQKAKQEIIRNNTSLLIRKNKFPEGYALLKNLPLEDWLTWIVKRITPHDNVTFTSSNVTVSVPLFEEAWRNCRAAYDTIYRGFLGDSSLLPDRKNLLGTLEQYLPEFNARYENIRREYDLKKGTIAEHFLNLSGRKACLLSRQQELHAYQQALQQLNKDKNMLLFLVSIERTFRNRKIHPSFTDLTDMIRTWLKRAKANLPKAEQALLDRKLRIASASDRAVVATPTRQSANSVTQMSFLLQENRQLKICNKDLEQENADLKQENADLKQRNSQLEQELQTLGRVSSPQPQQTSQPHQGQQRATSPQANSRRFMFHGGPTAAAASTTTAAAAPPPPIPLEPIGRPNSSPTSTPTNL